MNVSWGKLDILWWLHVHPVIRKHDIVYALFYMYIVTYAAGCTLLVTGNHDDNLMEKSIHQRKLNICLDFYVKK